MNTQTECHYRRLGMSERRRCPVIQRIVQICGIDPKKEVLLKISKHIFHMDPQRNEQRRLACLITKFNEHQRRLLTLLSSPESQRMIISFCGFDINRVGSMAQGCYSLQNYDPPNPITRILEESDDDDSAFNDWIFPLTETLDDFLDMREECDY